MSFITQNGNKTKPLLDLIGKEPYSLQNMGSVGLETENYWVIREIESADLGIFSNLAVLTKIDKFMNI